MTAKDRESGLAFTTKYEYNENNQVTKTYNAENLSTTNTYDALGRVTKVSTGETTVETVYTLSGQIKAEQVKETLYNDSSISDGVKTIVTNTCTATSNYGYDDLGRVVNTTSTVKSEVSTRTEHEIPLPTPPKPGYEVMSDGSNGVSTNGFQDVVESGPVFGSIIDYDINFGTFQPQFPTFDVKYESEYSYDLASNRTGFRLTQSGVTLQDNAYTYDSLNRLLTVSEGGKRQATYTYDVNGNRSSLSYANGVTETYAYNKANWVTNVVNKNGGGTISSFAYTYYASGSQRSKTDNTGKVTSYTYDGLGRLTKKVQIMKRKWFFEPWIVYVCGPILGGGIPIYRNHNVELLPVKPGVRAYDILLSETDSSLVGFEFDSYWFTDGGADAGAWMRRLGPRMKLWHINDRGSRMTGPAMTPILKADSMELGTGNMDLQSLWDIARENSVEAVVLESHKNWVDNDPVKSLELSAKWLRENINK